jgi:signal peptidase II
MSEHTAFGWKQSGLVWWPLGFATLVLDQSSKEVIVRVLMLHESVHVLPVFDIVRAHNLGAAFNFLADQAGWQRWVLTVFALAVSAGLLVALRRSGSAVQRLQNAGLILIVSGALGNAIDRMRHGYVVDFVHVHWNTAYFPAFNVADSCITVGAGLILLDALLEWRRTRRAAGGRSQ